MYALYNIKLLRQHCSAHKAGPFPRSAMPTQQPILQHIDTSGFPAPPAIVVRLVDLLARDDVTAEELGDTLSLDTSMAARVLKLANSVAVGGETPVESICDAVLRVGIEGVRDIVFSLAMVGAMRPLHFDYRLFWRHSLAVACTAQAFQLRLLNISRPFPETYTAGLLHDIGMLVLDHALGSGYREIMDKARSANRPLVDVEREILGTDHAVTGGRLLEAWHFPRILVDAVRCHHHPWAGGSGVTRLVQLADCACNLEGVDHGAGHRPVSDQEQLLGALGLAPEELPMLLAEVRGELQRAEAMLAAA
jgi:HD-like signal output (HDOD) protein